MWCKITLTPREMKLLLAFFIIDVFILAILWFLWANTIIDFNAYTFSLGITPTILFLISLLTILVRARKQPKQNPTIIQNQKNWFIIAQKISKICLVSFFTLTIIMVLLLSYSTYVVHPAQIVTAFLSSSIPLYIWAGLIAAYFIIFAFLKTYQEQGHL